MNVLSVFIMIFFMSVTLCSGQSIQLKVLSGNKLLFTGEEGKLEEIYREHYAVRKRELKDRISESIGEHMKIRTSQGLRDLTVLFGNPVFSVSQVNSDVMLSVSIPGNIVSYYITTRDYLGIGKDRSEDPFVSFKFTIKGVFAIAQQGDAETIEFKSPYWSYEVEENNSKKLQSLEWSKYINDDIRSMVGRIKEHYKLLNEVKDKFNYYVDEKIIENKSLQKEMLVDENNKLRVNAAGDKILVFNHEHSSAGILKRSTTTDASGITDKVNIPATVPTSTNASDINKKPASTNPPSKLPNSTKPTDLKKGVSGTKKG